jgi:hypothetical protein
MGREVLVGVKPISLPFMYKYRTASLFSKTLTLTLTQKLVLTLTPTLTQKLILTLTLT